MSGDTGKQAKKKNKSGGGNWDLSGLSIGSNDGALIVLLILVLLGVMFLVYAIALAFTYIISQGEVRRASRYNKKVREFGLDETEGTSLGKKLSRTCLYFSGVFFVFAAEETVRFVLHTGPADLPIWILRFACLAFFTAITGVFLVRLHRWRSFKSTQKYQQTSRQVAKLEGMLTNVK